MPITGSVNDHRVSIRQRWLTESAVIARELASGTSAIELNAANTTDFIFGHVPSPSGDSVPGLDSDLHGFRTLTEDVLSTSTAAQAPSAVDVKRDEAKKWPTCFYKHFDGPSSCTRIAAHMRFVHADVFPTPSSEAALYSYLHILRPRTQVAPLVLLKVLGSAIPHTMTSL